MRVAFLYNEFTEDPAYDPKVVMPKAFPVAEALRRCGHDVTPIKCTLDLGAARRRLRAAAPDVVFNHVEALGGSDHLMILATVLLDAMRLPYTGCDTAAMIASAGKISAKQRLIETGLPTPAWMTGGGEHQVYGEVSATAGPTPKAILKPVFEHASFNMGDDSVVPWNDDLALAAHIDRCEAKWERPYFAEHYIAGREFNIAVLDGEVLPLAEIEFTGFPEGKPHIVGHRAKWVEASFEYRHTTRRYEFPESDTRLLARLSDLTRRCWHLFGLRGYARVDFRVDAAGRPAILEVNANPSLWPDAGFAAALARAEIPYDAGIDRILESARARPNAVADRPA